MDIVILALINLIFPPLSVALHKGFGKDLAINILLCMLMWVPGVLHGFYVLLKDE